MTREEANQLVEGLGRRYVADALKFDLHRPCAAEGRCVAAGPTDVGEEYQERFGREIPVELTVDEDRFTELQNLFVDAFRAEWLAKVQPCK